MEILYQLINVRLERHKQKPLTRGQFLIMFGVEQDLKEQMNNIIANLERIMKLEHIKEVYNTAEEMPHDNEKAVK